MLLLLALLLIIQNVFAEVHSMNGTVYYDSEASQYSIKLGVMDCMNGAACGMFNDTLNVTGWGGLEIMCTKNSTSSRNIKDIHRMYASGYLEGYITSYQIINSYNAKWKSVTDKMEPYKEQITNWIQNQTNWMNKEIKSNPNDIYWKYVQLLQSQYNGLKAGYAAAAKDFNLQPLSHDFMWQFLNSEQEFGDLIAYFEYFVNKRKDVNDWLHSDIDPNEVYLSKLHRSHCSVLIKLLPEFDDIYFSHSTWTDYAQMNRIMKRYIFDLDLKVSSTEMLMSSYPGTLSSVDDFYLMNNGMAVTETTNLIYNNSLYSVLSPHTLFSWQRALISNALSDSGREWVDIFTRYNSGTYNNQWMILNHKLFKKGEPLSCGLLWILEQIPGNVSIEDVTPVLERGYWSSYNVPATQYVYRMTGNQEMAERNGVFMSYDLAPRARIFRRDANNVFSMEDNMRFMRYNNYKNDKIEHGNAGWAIMARYDLNDSQPRAFGGMDSKVTDLNMLNEISCVAQNGPTHDNLPPFSFSGQFTDYPHDGMPTTYDFGWVYIPPSRLTQ